MATDVQALVLLKLDFHAAEVAARQVIHAVKFEEMGN